MPVYEYVCRECNRRFSRFFWRISDAEGTRCRCGSSNLEQLVSRVAFHRSEESRLESLADPAQWGDLENADPRTMGKMMRKLGDELGEELGPEFDEVVDRLEAGEDPDEIEKSMGDVLGEGGGDAAGPDYSGGDAAYDNLF
ncbi:MAG TPA: zinc ribbon domain-containing protein [Acidobacteriota bacterium]|nr:zinc ribbon domain-containing protein [Acidobacteriota bacterium]HRV08074.1 zinc ribbon domain-containing protein [Acidobacteriota bacterium]